MKHKHSQNTQRSPEAVTDAVEREPQNLDVEEFGPWLMERDRKVFDMLEEYDRRHNSARNETKK